MKRILAFILAAIMIASMAAVAFAEESETTEVTIYDSKGELDKGGENFVVTPEKLRGLEGFDGEMVIHLDNEITATKNYEDLWKFSNAKNGDTVYVYYYVESATNVEVRLYNKHFADGTAATHNFPLLDTSTTGWHRFEFVLNKDCPAFGLHTKLASGATSGSYEIYFGDVVVREGTVVSEGFEKTVITSEQLAEGATKTDDEGVFYYVQARFPASSSGFTPSYKVTTPDAIKTAMGGKIGDTALKTENKATHTTLFSSLYTFEPGYKYLVLVNAYVEESNGRIYLDLNGQGNWTADAGKYIYTDAIKDKTNTAITIPFTADLTADSASNSYWNLSVHSMFKGYVGDIVIYKYDNMQYLEHTFTPEELVDSTQGVLSDDGLLFSKDAFTADSTRVLSSFFSGEIKKRITIEFEALDAVKFRFCRENAGQSVFLTPDIDGDGTFDGINGADSDDSQFWLEPGTYEYTLESELRNFNSLHTSGAASGLVVKSVTLANVGGNPVKETIRPIDVVGYTNKVENGKTADVFTAGADVFTAENNYVVTFNYKVLAGADVKTAPTLTVGDQTVTLEKTAGKYSVIVPVMNDADKFTVSAGDTTVIIGDITYYMAGEEFAELVETVQGITTDIKLEFTLVKTAEAAEAYIRSAAQKKYTDYTVLKVEVLDFALPTDDASVARASAAEGSVVAKVKLEQNETHLVYEETLTFSFYSNPDVSDYNAATGDSIIVAVVALVAIISLAGVVIAKKKVSSK